MGAMLGNVLGPSVDDPRAADYCLLFVDKQVTMGVDHEV